MKRTINSVNPKFNEGCVLKIITYRLIFVCETAKIGIKKLVHRCMFCVMALFKNLSWIIYKFRDKLLNCIFTGCYGSRNCVTEPKVPRVCLDGEASKCGLLDYLYQLYKPIGTGFDNRGNRNDLTTRLSTHWDDY